MIRIKGYIFIAVMLLIGDAVFAYKRIAVSSYKQLAVSHDISGAANMCTPHIVAIEQKLGIPNQLLNAIALVESGRWNKQSKKREPWPWAVQAQGKSYFFSTKADAIQAVRKMLNRGITNIDVGCMQINIGHHGDAFQTLSHMFDPAHNVAYGGQFLKRLKGKASSWSQAVAHYHSATPMHHIPYRKKVYKAWVQAQDGGRKGEYSSFNSDDGFDSLSTYQPHIIRLDSRNKASSSYGLAGARRLAVSKDQKG